MPPQDREFDRYACITIQGGGVYGISLLGQLQAVHERGFIPVALAGTSAGAIVSALYWAQLGPRQVFNALLKSAGSPEGLVGLVGSAQHDDGSRFGIDDPRRLSERVAEYRVEIRRAFVSSRDESVFVKCLHWLSSVVAARKVFSDAELVERFWKKCGIFRGDSLGVFLDDLLRTAPVWERNRHLLPPLEEAGQRRCLTFRDFGKAYSQNKNFSSPPLFLVATNLTTRSLELINSIEDRYQDWPVVEAVRASAGFPGFFTPVIRFENQSEFNYVDGGVIANFPAFVFSNKFRHWMAANVPNYDAIVMRPWVHIGLQLSASARSTGYAGESSDPTAFLSAMKDLLVSQARNQLEEKLVDFVPRSLRVRIPFDDTGGPKSVLRVESLRPEIVKIMFNNGKGSGDRDLKKYRFTLPASDKIEPLLKQLVDQVSSIFALDERPSSLKLRSNVFVPQREDLVLTYRFNMDNLPDQEHAEDEVDYDREIVLNYKYGLTGFCFVRRSPLICNLEKFKQLFDEVGAVDARKHFGFDKRMQGRIRKDRTWLMSYPIFDLETTSTQKPKTGLSNEVEGQHYVSLESPFDGAVFGVLNIDAGWNFSALGLDDDPKRHANDPRVLSVLDLLQGASIRISKVFSTAFPSQE